MADPQTDPAKDILSGVNAPDPIKAAAWDVYQVSDQVAFERRLKALPIPKEVKARLWDAKWKPTAVTPPQPPPTTPSTLARGAIKIGPPVKAHIGSDTFLERIGRATYAEIPLMTSTVFGGLAMAPFVAATPFTAGASDLAAPTAGLVGAGIGGLVGHGIQHVIDSVTGGGPKVQGTFGSEATKQMIFQAGGEILAKPLGMASQAVLNRIVPSKGVLLGSEAAEALDTNANYKLGLSTPEITGGSTGAFFQRAGTRSVAGLSMQAKIRQQADKSAQAAVTRILDQIGPETTETQAGAAAQGTVRSMAQRAEKRVEGAITTKISPATGTAATGRSTKEGVLAARRGLSAVQAEYGKIVDEGPNLDMRELKQATWRQFKHDILPALINFPALGPNTEAYKVLQSIHLIPDASLVEAGPELLAQLEKDPILKANSATLNAFKRILTARDIVPFNAAVSMRSALREAGRAPDVLLGTPAKGFSTHLASELRKVMAEAYPAWDAAAAAYGPEAQAFQQKFITNLIGKDPEQVLASLGGATGRVRSTQVRRLGKLLLGTAAKSADKADAEAGKAAWNTLRGEWMRREVFQGDVFGMTDRLTKIDPEVLRAWFPDAVGQDVLKRATVAGGQFESSLLKDVATKDPATILAHVAQTPSRVNEMRTVLTSHPEVGGPQTWQRLQRARVQEFVGTSVEDLGKMGGRITKASPEELSAWFPGEKQQALLTDLRKIGSALGRRASTPMGSLYKIIEFSHVAGTAATGNLTGAMTALGLYEGVPALITWGLYNPRFRRMLVQGVTAKDPKVASALLFRVLDAYAQERQRQQAQSPGAPQQQKTFGAIQ